jgi:zinc D-Ala-D-Ala dipeptidase
MTAASFVLISDPAVRNVPILDSGEPLITLRYAGDRVFIDASGSHAAHRSPLFHLVRTGVRSRLLHAAARLPAGVGLLVLEGFRPLSHQSALFERYRQRFAAEHPHARAEQIERLTSRFVAPIDVAGHPAGAAVDLTLCNAQGRPLDMGTAPNEAVAASALHASDIDIAARARRHLLAETLAAQDFINYPSEWWHWSYGDRYWAFASRAPAAVYGAVDDTALTMA